MPENRQAGLGDAVAVVVVDLVAVAVTLGDPGRAVQLLDDRAGLERGLVQAEAHRAAQVAVVDDLDLLGHRRDDRELGVGVELARRGAGEPDDVARVLDHHALQAEAQAEHRDAVLAREPQCAELALDAAHAESAGHEDAVDVGEMLRRALGGLALVRRDPADVDLGRRGRIRRP